MALTIHYLIEADGPLASFSAIGLQLIHLLPIHQLSGQLVNEYLLYRALVFSYYGTFSGTYKHHFFYSSLCY